MPFYALPYHIGVWKGMEGHREGNGHKLEEGPMFKHSRNTFMAHYIVLLCNLNPGGNSPGDEEASTDIPLSQ